MKVSINHTPTVKRVIGYPVVKENTTDTGFYSLVYFIKPEEGLLLYTNYPRYLDLVGKVSKDWEEENFKEFSGTVTLSNF